MKNTHVTFLNQPKLSPHSIDQEVNENRILLAREIEVYLQQSDLFKSKEVEVSFFQEGVSSLVSLLKTKENSYVLKIQLRSDGPKGEALFLKKWESVDVSVPHIYEEGFIAGHAYMLMEFIDTKTLGEYTEKELCEENIFYKIGEALARMHKTEAHGYGCLTENGAGEYASFEAWLKEFPQTQNQIGYIKKHDLLNEKICGSLDIAQKVLIEHSLEAKVTCCHGDFAPGNIFNTTPLTVFDSVPMANIAYIDLGRSILKHVDAGFASQDMFAQLVDGYFTHSAVEFDQEVLYASLVFNAHTILPHIHKTNQIERFDRIINFLMDPGF